MSDETTIFDDFADAMVALHNVDMSTIKARDLWELFEKASSAKRVIRQVSIQKMMNEWEVANDE